MNLGLPTHGFVDLLTTRETFVRTFTYTSILSCVRNGRFPIIDPSVLNLVHALWCDTVVEWIGDQKSQENDYYRKLSHIKMAGCMLWAFNQYEQVGLTVAACDNIREKDHFAISSHGLDENVRELDPDKASILKTYPTQSNAYLYTTHIFNMVQRGRVVANPSLARSGIDLNKTPMTFHYLQNICWSLLCDNPGKEELYMVFKTMDLYGLKLRRST